MNQSRKPAGSPGGSGGQFDSNGGQFSRSELPAPTGMTVTDSGIASAPGARLRGADLSCRELDDLTGADLIDANLQHADLSAGRLDRAHLEGADARGANFFHASLDHTHMATADLKGARMRFANLDHTDMRFTDLSQATLEGAGITGARFNKADLTGADLSRAIVMDTSFRGATMATANLHGAMLENCDLSDADIRGMDMTGIGVKKLTISDSTRLDGVTLHRFQVRQIRDSNGRFVGEKTLTERGATVTD